MDYYYYGDILEDWLKGMNYIMKEVFKKIIIDWKYDEF